MLPKLVTAFLRKFKFLAIIICRLVIVLFRRKKAIELLHLDYCKDHLFENSYVILHYRFRNAVSYSFGNHYTLEKHIKIFNLKNFQEDIDFVVYGFFQKKSYKLSFKPTLSLSTGNLKTEFVNLRNNLEFKSIPNLTSPDFYPEVNKPIFNSQKIGITIPAIKLKPTIYNQTDFI